MIGDRLNLLRKEKELTQQDVAKMLDVSHSTYTQYETGNSEPDLATVNKLAKFFETSSDYLLGRTGIKNPPESIAAHHDGDEWTEEGWRILSSSKILSGCAESEVSRMDNQQFQNAVLDKLEQLTTRLDSMDNRMDSMEANMATKDELAGIEKSMDTLATQVGTLDKKVDRLDIKVDCLDIKVDRLDKKVDNLQTIVVKIENEHGQKLGALFDGYTLNSEKLDRVEKAVARHEEAALTKVK